MSSDQARTSTTGPPGEQHVTQRPQRTLAPGTVLEDRYQVRRIIGRGGMSTVYAARDLRFGQVERITALKEMVDHDPDPGTRALRLVNFERESAMLATIAHAAVPKIYDYFSHEGLVYLVLEYIEGQDLERALEANNGPFDEARLIQWTREICSVLETLHNNEPDPIIFRDLKPSNIMLRKNGQIALIDFGIARMFQNHQRGTMIGTEGYAPPEQYRGIADYRGDIYALGATLHHLATDSDPRQETPFTFQERQIRSLNPEISEDFAAILTRMLAYHPDQRYQSVEEILSDLSRLEDARVRARVESTEPTPSSQQVEPTESTTRGTSIFTGSMPSSSLGERRFSRRRSSRKRFRSRRTAGETSESRILWQVETNDEVRGSALIAGDLSIIGSYDRVLYALDTEEGSVVWKFEAGEGIVSRPAIVDDLVIFGSEDGIVYGLSSHDGSLRWTCRTGRAVRSSPHIASDSTIIIGSDDGSIYGLEPEFGEIKWRQRAWGPVRSSAIHRGSTAFIGSDDGSLYALSVDDGSVLWKQTCGGPVRCIPALDGERIVVSSWTGLISAFTLQRGIRVWQHNAESQLASSPTISDGTVVIGAADGALIGLNGADGSPKWSNRFANQITSTAKLGQTMGLVGTVDGDCAAFKIQDGELLWKHRIGGPMVSTPAVGDDNVIIGSLDGYIYGLSLNEEEAADFELGAR